MNVDPDDMFAYVYVRENVAGAHHEFWYHGAGCHAWLVVERDTRTHEVLKVETARDAALARSREGR
jgi:sarcosine oxidase subunit delta